MSRKSKTSKTSWKSKTKRLTIFNIRASSSGVRMAGASPILGKKVTVFPLCCPIFPDPLPICNSGKFRMIAAAAAAAAAATATATTTTTTTTTKMHRNDENKNRSNFALPFFYFYVCVCVYFRIFHFPLGNYSCEKSGPGLRTGKPVVPKRSQS